MQESVWFQTLKTMYDSYVSFKILAKFLDESDICEVLNCWQWPQELMLDLHKCLEVDRYGLFEANTDISKNFNIVFCFIIKNVICFMLYLFFETLKIRIYKQEFLKL